MTLFITALFLLLAAPMFAIYWWGDVCEKCGHRHIKRCRHKVYQHGDWYDCGCGG